MDIQEQFRQHEHNGKDSKKVKGRNLERAPQSKLITASVTALTTGGGAVLSVSDQTIIDNMRTRINELETRLQALGLLY